MTTDKIDEIALRVAKKQSSEVGVRNVGEDFILRYTHALLAELSKDVEPSCIVSDTGIIQNVTDRPLEPGLKLFTLPIPANTAEIEQRVAENFVHKFKRHAGGDGEFWLHELECFCEEGKWREYL